MSTWRETEHNAMVDKILRDLDVDAMGKYLKTQGFEKPKVSTCAVTGRPVPYEYVLLLTIHKTRYEKTSLPDKLRHESAEWLRQRWHNRLGGLPIMPEGHLPNGV